MKVENFAREFEFNIEIQFFSEIITLSMNVMKSEKENTPGHVNKNNQTDQEYRLDQANGNIGDPSSKRNIGLNGETQRNNQKDELGNLHISGDEVTGYGDNNYVDSEENSSGPGFEAEGSDSLDDILTRE